MEFCPDNDSNSDSDGSSGIEETTADDESSIGHNDGECLIEVIPADDNSIFHDADGGLMETADRPILPR